MVFIFGKLVIPLTKRVFTKGLVNIKNKKNLTMIKSEKRILSGKKKNAKSKRVVIPQEEKLIEKNSDQANQFDLGESSLEVSELVVKKPEFSDWESSKPQALQSNWFLQNGYIFIKLFIFNMYKRLKTIFSSKHDYYFNWILFHFFHFRKNQILLQNMSYTGEMITDFIGGQRFEENVQDIEHKINHSKEVKTIFFFSEPLSYLEASKNLDERLDPCMDFYKNLFLKNTVKRPVKNFNQLHFSNFIWCSYIPRQIEWFIIEQPGNYNFEWFKNTNKKNSTYLLSFLNGARLSIDHWQLITIPPPSPWMHNKITSENLLNSLNSAIYSLGQSPIILHANCYDFNLVKSQEPMHFEFYEELFSLGVFPSNTGSVWGPTIVGFDLIDNFNKRYQKILSQMAPKQSYPLEEFYLQNSRVKEKLIQDSLEKYHLMIQNPISVKDFNQKFDLYDGSSILAIEASLYREYFKNLLDQNQSRVQILLDNYNTLCQNVLSENDFTTSLKEKIKSPQGGNLDFSNPKQVYQFYRDSHEQLQQSFLNNLQDMNTKVLQNYIAYLLQNTRSQSKEKPSKLLQPINPQVNLSIFEHALELSTRTRASHQKKSFIAARNRIAMFLLFFTGMHVSTLQNTSLWQLEKFFSNNQQSYLPGPSSKTTASTNSTPNSFLVDTRVREKYLFQGFKLYEDYQYLLECIKHYALKNKIPMDQTWNFSFFGQSNHFGKTCSRPNTNKIVNELLRKAVKASFPPSANVEFIQSFTSNSFRLYVCKYIIRTYGIRLAQRFMNHVSFTTTILYDLESFPQEIIQQISKGLATHKEDWGPKQVRFSDQLIDQLCVNIADGVAIEPLMKTFPTQMDDKSYNYQMNKRNGLDTTNFDS